MKKAVILFSGGLDSTTCLNLAKSQGFACHALSIVYEQRHDFEIKAAQQIAQRLSIAEHRIVSLDIGQFGGSALTDSNIAVPSHQALGHEIPVTYVPARNTVFLGVALSFAEAIGAYDIFIGANAIDYSNYPDCRPEFIAAFQALANIATKEGVEGKHFTIHAPLLHLHKAEIIQLGVQLGIDYSATVSCYQVDERGAACGHCDSCALRRQGFIAAQRDDPTLYQNPMD